MFSKLLDLRYLSLIKTNSGFNIGVRDMLASLNLKTLADQKQTITYGDDSFDIDMTLTYSENMACLSKNKNIKTHNKHLFALSIYEEFLPRTNDIIEIIKMIKELRDFTGNDDVINKFLFIETGRKIIDENLYQNPDEKQKHILLATEMNDVYKHSEYPQDIERSLGDFDLILEIVSPIRQVDSQ